MAKKAFRLRLPEHVPVSVSLAEFPITRPGQAGEMARRARLLAALAELPPKRRNDLGKAVAEACRVAAAGGTPVTARFGIGEVERERLIEVVLTVGDEERRSTAQTESDDEALAKLTKLGASLSRFELNGFPAPATAAVLAQAAPDTFRMPSENERAHWADLLQAATAEDAVVLAQQRGRQSIAELGYARMHQATPEAVARAAAERHDLETLSLVVDKETHAIAIMDADGDVQWVNKAFSNLTGYSAAEVLGRRLDELLFGPDTSPEAVHEFHQAVHNGHELTQDMVQYRHDGRTFWVECQLIPVRDNQGRLSRWIAIQSDITARHRSEEALLAAKQSAEASSRAKSEFLANMSHEIRTPLNAILGMTELALTTELSREQRDYLRTVQSSADTLLQLLNDVLDLSKIEAGKMEIEQVDFNLAKIVQETTSALAVRAHEKGLELAVHVPMDVPQCLRGDPTRLRQMLFNLVGNAIKFTERGEVVVEVEQQWRSEEEVGLHFSVRDTGIGIPPDKLERIFESFAQAESSMARRFGGSGLGLTITSQLVRLMGGRIWVQSAEGEGSTFHFTLRLKLGEAPPVAANLDRAELPDKRVLVVDDNATNRHILDEMLRHWQMKPTLADGAAAALKELEEAARRDEPFDVVLLDAMMPVVDGFQLAEMIRQRPDLRCGTVMMLSSADRPDSATRCRQLGIAAHMAKPVSQSGLLEAIVTALAGEAASQPLEELKEEAPPDVELARLPPPKRALHVLVADDHEPNRTLAMKILQRRGHRCTPAGDGDEAAAACAQEAFDAVLMDVQMPGCDGFAATRQIREREKRTGSHVPIIALTAHALSGDREKCLAAGMDAYLAKPIHARELVAVVERVTGVSPDGQAPESHRPRPAKEGCFDFSAALDRMGGEMDLLKEHMNCVLSEVPQLLEAIREAMDRSDAPQLAISAHRLKSLVSGYDQEEARELAWRLEHMGKNAQFGDAPATLESLAPLAEEFLDAMKRYLDQQGGP